MIGRFGSAAAVLFLAGCAATQPTASPGADSGQVMDSGQLVFAEPEQAVETLKEAAKHDDLGAYQRIFGPEVKELLESGDPVADKHGRDRFANAVLAKVLVERAKLDTPSPALQEVAFLSIGEEELSFPIALVRNEKGWRYDTAVGKEEILDRRVGENELNVLDLLEEYYFAQQAYAAEGHDGEPAGFFASKLLSTPGKHDGLFWEGEPRSPLGPLVADMEQEGYRRSSAGPIPIYGYYFHVLKKQGANARGGAKDFQHPNGKLEGGFAVVAYPAVWGNSGVMTFILGPDGIAFQKNLGPKTKELASTMEVFDPDLSWDPA